MKQITLASLCGLEPLDRVQVIDAAALDKQRVDRTLYREHDPRLPFAYFQRLMPDGTIALAGPSGASFRVEPTQVCDVIKGKRLEILAMRDSQFRAFLALPINERGKADLSWYEPALLTSVELDRWGRVDRCTVQFMHGDPSDGASTIGVYRKVHEQCLQQIKEFARRTNLPVIKASSYARFESADQQIKAAEAKNTKAFNRFVRQSIS